ncbi:hypothetical protein DUI87_17802 [Hirundo rustica rustica]|uniref:Uncharacterized protein n=1 Tax=Hirundo rustica rustica TaxID=333673 RepID=A0A3M0JV85_HIRRU|nr:hypothetical protein DUI87_17802 [Hirundo rustica rustica]
MIWTTKNPPGKCHQLILPEAIDPGSDIPTLLAHSHLGIADPGERMGLKSHLLNLGFGLILSLGIPN